MPRYSSPTEYAAVGHNTLVFRISPRYLAIISFQDFRGDFSGADWERDFFFLIGVWGMGLRGRSHEQQPTR